MKTKQFLDDNYLLLAITKIRLEGKRFLIPHSRILGYASIINIWIYLSKLEIVCFLFLFQYEDMVIWVAKQH